MSIQAGDSGAMFKLSQMYDEGLGVQKSKTKALSWFNKGAALMQQLSGARDMGGRREGTVFGERGFRDMMSWGGVARLAQTQNEAGSAATSGNADEVEMEEEEGESEAAREKFEAWCMISTTRQIGLFHQLQAQLNEAEAGG